MGYEVIIENIVDGDNEAVVEEVNALLAQNVDPMDIISNGLMAGMTEVGDLFKEGELFVPEVLGSAMAMQEGLEVVKPLIAGKEQKKVGTIVIGTVMGDLHDLGKNLVGMMMESNGFEVINLGTDVSPETFVEAVKEHDADIVGMSALLTTTMKNMAATITKLEEAGLRDKVKVMVGGAPVTNAFAAQIGADNFSADATSAVDAAKALLA